MRRPTFALIIVLALVLTSGVRGQQTPPAQPAPAQRPTSTFRGAVNLILVDVDVRDKNGQPIKGLKQSDFEIIEDGKSQDILTFAYEEIAATATAVQSATMLSTAGAEKGAVPVTVAAPKPAAQPATPPPDAGDKPAAVDAVNGPLTTDEVAGHRVWVLLFDTSSMQPEDVQKAADAALKWTETKMTPADLVAVASIGSTLQILQDFTTDKDAIHKALAAFEATDGTAAAEVDASTM